MVPNKTNGVAQGAAVPGTADTAARQIGFCASTRSSRNVNTPKAFSNPKFKDRHILAASESKGSACKNIDYRNDCN